MLCPTLTVIRAPILTFQELQHLCTVVWALRNANYLGTFSHGQRAFFQRNVATATTKIRLVLRSEWQKDVRYIALSYAWGNNYVEEKLRAVGLIIHTEYLGQSDTGQVSGGWLSLAGPFMVLHSNTMTRGPNRFVTFRF